MKQQAKLYRERRPVRGRVGRTGGCRAVALRRGDKGRGTDKAGGEAAGERFRQGSAP